MEIKKNIKDLTGKTYGRSIVINFAFIRNNKAFWNCKCSCGNTHISLGCSLTVGDTKSCGCLQKETISKRMKKHGLSKTAEYGVWIQVKERCLNEKNKNYSQYGGRGIKICKRWLYSFNNFIFDMGHRPTEKHSIERINNNGDYKPSNCKWATWLQQANNKRNNIHKIKF